MVDPTDPRYLDADDLAHMRAAMASQLEAEVERVATEARRRARVKADRRRAAACKEGAYDGLVRLLASRDQLIPVLDAIAAL